MSQKPKEFWNRRQEEMMLNFEVSGHPVFRQVFDSLQHSSTQNRNNMIEHLPETARLVTVYEDARCVRTVSKGPYVMTDEFDNASVCREYIFRRHRPDSYSKEANDVNTRIDPALEVVVTNVPDMYGVEIKI